MNKLVWSDDFNNNGFPDLDRWTFEIQDPGWVNNELQQYVKNVANCRVENGNLILEAHYHPESSHPYTSARIKSQFHGDWKYGRFEVKAKLPHGRGTWPAIWAMPTDSTYGIWPRSGEIDIMEHVGYDPGQVHASIHCEDYCWRQGTQKTASITNESVEDEFHLYFMNWTENQIEIGMDDIIFFRYNKPKDSSPTNWPFDQKFYLILNIAVGGVWGGEQGVDNTIFPQQMRVDFVRIYQ